MCFNEHNLILNTLKVKIIFRLTKLVYIKQPKILWKHCDSDHSKITRLRIEL